MLNQSFKIPLSLSLSTAPNQFHPRKPACLSYHCRVCGLWRWQLSPGKCPGVHVRQLPPAPRHHELWQSPSAAESVPAATAAAATVPAREPSPAQPGSSEPAAPVGSPSPRCGTPDHPGTAGPDGGSVHPVLRRCTRCVWRDDLDVLSRFVSDWFVALFQHGAPRPPCPVGARL